VREPAPSPDRESLPVRRPESGPENCPIPYAAQLDPVQAPPNARFHSTQIRFTTTSPYFLNSQVRTTSRICSNQNSAYHPSAEAGLTLFHPSERHGPRPKLDLDKSSQISDKKWQANCLR
jgi:hypothetical protein